MQIVQPELKRPLGITIIIVYFALEGIFYFYSNSIGMFGGKDLSTLFSGTMAENAIIAYSFAMGLFNFAMIWAFLERKPWARLTTIVVFGFTAGLSWILTQLGFFTWFNSSIVTVVSAIIIIYLLKPVSKKYFS